MHKAMEVNEKIMHESANMLEKHGYSESYFHALSQALDNIKDIDWRASARSMNILVREHVAEKKHNILFILDSRYDMNANANEKDLKKDICINIMLPVAAIICTSSVPSIVLCNNLYEYLLQLIAILLMNGLVAAFPIMHWLKKPIQELKKER